MQQKANPTCSSAWCLKQQAQFAEWNAKQVGRRTAFEILFPSFLLLCRTVGSHTAARSLSPVVQLLLLLKSRPRPPTNGESS
jgi:hypothetical protein